MLLIRLLLAHRGLATLICVAALLLKVLIPSGYMIAADRGTITVSACPGVVPAPVAMVMTGMHGEMPHHGQSKDQGKAEMPCAFASLSAQALGAADPGLLLPALAYVATIALLFVPQTAARRQAYLRPPLRGPPLYSTI